MVRRKRRSSKTSKAKEKHPPVAPTPQEISRQYPVPASSKLISVFSSIKRLLILGLLFASLFLFIPGVWLFRGLVNDYLVLGFNPMYVFFRLPEVNILLSTAFFFIFLIVSFIIFRVFKRSTQKSIYVRIMLLLSMVMTISASLGCIHSFIYYLDQDAYLIDEKILAIQSRRNEIAIADAVSKTERKIETLRQLKRVLEGHHLKLFPTKHSRGRMLGTRTIFTDNYLDRYEVQGFEPNTEINIKRYLTTCKLEIKYQDEELYWIGLSKGFFRGGEPPLGLLQDYEEFCKPFLQAPQRIEKQLLLTGFRLTEKFFENILRDIKTNQETGKFNILTWDLFAYDTVLSSLAFNQGYFKSTGLFSRTLTLAHAVSVIIFVFFIGPHMYEIWSKRRKNE